MAKAKKDGTKVSYVLSNDILKELETFCEETGRSRTKVIEMALKKYLEENRKDKN